MKAKRGYREDKFGEKYSKRFGYTTIGKWLKRYFEKRTCRRKKVKDVNT